MHDANMSCNQQEHDSCTLKDWHSWCRLCAKEDARNVDFFLKEEFIFAAHTSRTEEQEQTLIIAIQKYFNVEFKEGQQLPNHLCPECFSLTFSLVAFNERVAKVQEMFFELHNLYETTEMDIRNIRLKYGVMDNDRTHEMTIPSPLLNKSRLFDNVKNCYENVDAEQVKRWSEKLRFDMEIKEECSNDNAATTDDEDVCDIEIENIEQKDDEDPFGSEIELSNVSDKRPFPEGLEDEKELKREKNCRKLKNGKKKLNSSEKVVQTVAESHKYRYLCSECPQRFQRVGSYSVHLRKKHGIADVAKFTCTKCSRSFKNAFNLKRHMETHRPPAEKKIFPCPQCDRKFQTKDYVATHIKFVHEDIRPLICEECGEGVRTQGALREHMLTHTDYAPFECEICKKCFKNQSRLKNHMEIHSSDKHECSECGLQLNSRVTLNRHMLVHSDAMHHKCDYCGRSFKRAKTLKSHLILHSGIKPYSCEFCDRSFTSGSNCRTHMKRQHPNELAELEASGEKKFTRNIPKLAVLKSVMKTADNLIPVVSKQSGNFAVKNR